jgi:hypothetical protein
MEAWRGAPSRSWRGNGLSMAQPLSKLRLAAGCEPSLFSPAGRELGLATVFVRPRSGLRLLLALGFLHDRRRRLD